MHYKRYIIRDGIPIMPDTATNTTVIVYTYLNGTRLDISKRTHDILDFGYIVEYYDTLAAINDIVVKCFVRVREKSTNKIYEGESTGYRINFNQGSLWPQISEV